MRDVQGLSYQDIQETLEISESQVKVYLHRGRRKLRENTALKLVFSSYLGLESKRDSATAKDSRARSD